MTNEDSNMAPRRSVRRLLIGVVVALGVVAVSIAIWQTLRWRATQEDAQAVLLVEQIQPLPGFGMQEKESIEEYERRKQRIAAFMTSPLVLSAVVKRSQSDLLRRQRNPKELLAQRLYVEHSPDSEIMIVGMKGSKSERDDLKRIVDLTVEEFFRFHEGENERKLLTRITVLERETAAAKHRVEHLSRELAEEKKREKQSDKNSLAIEFLEMEVEHAQELVYSMTKASLALKISSKAPSSIRRLDKGAELVSHRPSGLDD